MRCTTETTSRSQASEEAAAPSVITKEHIVMSRRLISPDSSATISGEVAVGTLLEGRARLAGRIDHAAARVPTRARPDSTDRRTGRRDRRSTHRRPRNLDPNAGRSL